MKIGVIKEIHAGEKRVAATPETVGQLIKLGYAIAVESGAGANLGHVGIGGVQPEPDLAFVGVKASFEGIDGKVFAQWMTSTSYPVAPLRNVIAISSQPRSSTMCR